MGRYIEEGLFCIERESSLEVKYTSHEDNYPGNKPGSTIY